MNAKKTAALQALLISRTNKEAANVAGIDEKTLRGYLKDDEFIAAYKKAAHDMISQATRQAQMSLTAAVMALRNITENEDEKAASRIMAARSILEYGLRLTEFSDILKELETLEG